MTQLRTRRDHIELALGLIAIVLAGLLAATPVIVWEVLKW